MYLVLLLAVSCYGFPMNFKDDVKTNQIERELITQSTLNLIFQNINQSDFGSNVKRFDLSNTANDVNTDQHWRSNRRTSLHKELSDNDETYFTSHQENTQDGINSVNGSYPISQSELIKQVFGSKPGFKNDNSPKKREQKEKEDIPSNENKVNIEQNYLKEVFGKNWDKENKPINKDNLDPILNILGSNSRNDRNKDTANNHNGDKPIEQYLHDVFGNIWDTENKPISQDNYLNFFGSFSKADRISELALDDKNGAEGQDTLFLNTKNSQNEWNNDYEQRYFSNYVPWTKHSGRSEVEHDRQDYFGNGLDYQFSYHNGLKSDC